MLQKLMTALLCGVLAVSASLAHAKPKKAKDKDHPNNERYLADEEYLAGRDKRRTGILLTSIGGGVGGVMLVGGFFWYMCMGASEEQKPKCQRNAGTAMGVGAVVTGGSLGVGIPFIVSGRQSMRAAQSRIDGEFPVKEEPAGEPEAKRNRPSESFGLAVQVVDLRF